MWNGHSPEGDDKDDDVINANIPSKPLFDLPLKWYYYYIYINKYYESTFGLFMNMITRDKIILIFLTSSV